MRGLQMCTSQATVRSRFKRFFSHTTDSSVVLSDCTGTNRHFIYGFSSLTQPSPRRGQIALLHRACQKGCFSGLGVVEFGVHA